MIHRGACVFKHKTTSVQWESTLLQGRLFIQRFRNTLQPSELHTKPEEQDFMSRDPKSCVSLHSTPPLAFPPSWRKSRCGGMLKTCITQHLALLTPEKKKTSSGNRKTALTPHTAPGESNDPPPQNTKSQEVYTSLLSQSFFSRKARCTWGEGSVYLQAIINWYQLRVNIYISVPSSPTKKLFSHQQLHNSGSWPPQDKLGQTGDQDRRFPFQPIRFLRWSALFG